jgi:hypothetical protein
MAGLRWEAILAFAVAGGVLFLRLRRLAQERELKPARLWILPALLFAMLAITTIVAPPPLWGLAVMLAAFLAGGFIGWKRGQLTHIWRDKECWKQKSSPLALMLLVAVIAFKFIVREMTGGSPIPDAGKPLDSPAQIVSDALLAFLVAMVSMTRIEMALRCKRIEAGKEKEGRG